MKNEKRFKKGDKVTYKNRRDCVSSSGYKGNYYHGGIDQDGNIGEILNYGYYNEEMDCWKITVKANCSINGYHMLESEFLEYDKPVNNELFPIY